MVIFQEEVGRYTYKVVSMLLGKKLHQNLMICFFAGGHLVHSGHIGGHFKKKVDEDVREVGQIL